MEKDFELREIPNAVGSERYEVIAKLLEGEGDPYAVLLGAALIQTGAVRHADFLFRNIGENPCVIFKVMMGTNDKIYPLIAEANYIFSSAVREALRLERIIDAIRLCDEGSK